jgi:hypothetical protein
MARAPASTPDTDPAPEPSPLDRVWVRVNSTVYSWYCGEILGQFVEIGRTEVEISRAQWEAIAHMSDHVEIVREG